MDEKHLLRDIANGDRNAFEILAMRYYVPLTVFAMRMTGDRDTAEDIVQDAFVYLWEKRRSLNDAQHMRNYLYLIVRNYSIDHRRSTTRIRPLQNEAYLKEEEISAHYIRTETIRLLHEAVGKLPPRTAEVVRLTLEGMKQEQIAAQMGITLATVKALKGEGIKKLREMIGPLVLLAGVAGWIPASENPETVRTSTREVLSRPFPVSPDGLPGECTAKAEE